MPEESAWQRLHPATPALQSLRLAGGLLLAIGFSFAGGEAVPALLVWALVVALVLGVAAVVLRYFFFRYRVTSESLVIVHGILFRKRRIIPRSRLQNIDLRANLLEQILGVVRARVETAGGQESEAALSVVDREEGQRLRRELVPSLTHRAAPEPAVESAHEHTDVPEERPPRPDRRTLRVGIRDLLIAGATSSRAGVLIGAIFGGDYLFGFMPTDWLLQRWLPPELAGAQTTTEALTQLAEYSMDSFVSALAVMGVFFAVAGWALSILMSVVRYFDFTLTGGEKELRVSYGLFTRHEKGFRRQRVQNVQIDEPLLRRLLGFASLRAQTAGYSPSMKAEDRVETLSPLARRDGIPEFLAPVYPDLDWSAVEWRPSHPKARRRLFVRRAVVVLLGTGAVAVLLRPWGFLLPLLGLVGAWFMAGLQYRHLGHARQGDYVLTREGFWSRRTFVLPVRRVQTLHLTATPFQRRLGLATMVLETAGSPLAGTPGHSEARAIDLGRGHGLDLMGGLANDVTVTGLTF